MNKSNSNPADGSETWMLFEDGGSARIEVSLYPAPSENNRPIDAYVVTELEGGAFSRTARRAANAFYDAATEFRKDLSPCVAGFDLSGNNPVVGESGGLAFLVTLAKRLLEMDPGPVAATGVISSSSAGWRISRVNGIKSKLTAAIELLPKGGRILYPEDNENDISEDIREQIQNKTLRLIPVSTVFDALDKLFIKSVEKDPVVVDQKNDSDRKTNFLPIVLAVIVLCLCGAGAALWYYKHKDAKALESPEVITQKIPGGEKSSSKLSYPFDDNQSMSTQSTQPSGLAKKTLRPETPVTIELGGKSGFSTSLAWQLEEKLISHFSEGSNQPNDKVLFKGKVVVKQILEEWVEDLENYMTKMILAIQGFYFQRGAETIQFPFIEIEVEGEGMAEGLLRQAGDQMYNEILKGLEPNYSPRNLSENILVPRHSAKPSMPNSAPGFE